VVRGRARRSGAEEGERRREEGGGRGKKKKWRKEKKMEREKEKWKRKGKKEKEKGEEREERERKIRAALIAASTAGPVGRAQRSRVRADGATGKKGFGGVGDRTFGREKDSGN